jgi:hypothetical protein
LEEPADRWGKSFGRDHAKWPIELHVPCRKPLDHFLSQCNYRGVTFNCNANVTGLEAQINKCNVGMSRFSFNMTKNLPPYDIKCFDPFPLENYINYSYSILQPRRLPVQYINRESNKPRNKDKECLLKEENAEVWQYVLKRLHEKYDYVRFCDQCMGSKNDLFAYMEG